MKFILEILPLILFFVTYKKYGIITATICMVIATLINVAFMAFKSKKISLLPLLSAGFLAIFGFLTWYLRDPSFIKIKFTIVNLLFGLIFLIGAWYRKPTIKLLFAGGLEMSDAAWLKLSIRFGIFFLLMGLANELVWRNVAEELWVNLKLFVFLPMSLLFTISQMPFMMRQQKIYNSTKE